MARRQRGVTLIELVLVIVLLGITAAIMAPVIGSNLRAYSQTMAHTDLAAQGRLALDRLAREVRHAVPGSLRVSSDQRSIEFVRSRGGGRYVAVGDSADGSWCSGVPGTAFTQSNRCFTTDTALHELYVLGAALKDVENHVLVLGATGPSDLKAAAVALKAVKPTDPAVDGTDEGQVLELDAGASGKVFMQASLSQRFFIADHTIRAGLDDNGRLRWAERPGVEHYGGGASWNSDDPVLAEGVKGIALDHQPATAYAPELLAINLTFEASGLTLYQNIQVRNAR